MNEPLIRPAGLSDIPVITEIYRGEVLERVATFETEPPSREEMERRMRALTDRGYSYLAAEVDGVLVGSGYAGPYRPREAYRCTVEDSIYLAPEARGHGIGGRLLRALIDESQTRGFRQMVAVISATDDNASVRLHRAAGFLTIGTMPGVGYKHGRWVDTIVMQRALGVGATAPPAST